MNNWMIFILGVAVGIGLGINFAAIANHKNLGQN